MSEQAVQPVLNKEDFDVVKNVSALKVPKKQCATAMRLLKGFTFNVPRVKCLVDCPGDTDHKLLLLDEAIPPGTTDGLPDALQQRIQSAPFTLQTHEVKVTYDQLSSHDILKRVLPEGCDVPASFETVGHIAHFNLREEHLPYRHIIGQVCIDKNPAIRTVVTKVGEIQNEYRVFAMEAVAGEQSFITEVSQHGIKFRMDFSKVFWNSRLENEHRRLVEKYFKPGQAVADIMAGIGPFAIPAARKGCKVFANDLNPDSVRWMKENIKLNKVEGAVQAFCMDGRDFVRLLCSTPGGPAHDFDALGSAPHTEEQPGPVPEGWKPPEGGVLWHHGVMNLPATAVDFCDVFRGAFPSDVWQGRLPMIHCYTFQKSESREDVIHRIEAALGGKLDDEALDYVEVRHVAPDKFHVCVSFRIPEQVAFGDVDGGPASKKARVS